MPVRSLIGVPVSGSTLMSVTGKTKGRIRVTNPTTPTVLSEFTATWQDTWHGADMTHAHDTVTYDGHNISCIYRIVSCLVFCKGHTESSNMPRLLPILLRFHVQTGSKMTSANLQYEMCLSIWNKNVISLFHYVPELLELWTLCWCASTISTNWLLCSWFYCIVIMFLNDTYVFNDNYWLLWHTQR